MSAVIARNSIKQSFITINIQKNVKINKIMSYLNKAHKILFVKIVIKNIRSNFITYNIYKNVKNEFIYI